MQAKVKLLAYFLGGVMGIAGIGRMMKSYPKAEKKPESPEPKPQKSSVTDPLLTDQQQAAKAEKAKLSEIASRLGRRGGRPRKVKANALAGAGDDGDGQNVEPETDR